MAEGCIDYWHSEQLVLCRDDELGSASCDRDQ